MLEWAVAGVVILIAVPAALTWLFNRLGGNDELEQFTYPRRRRTRRR
jgi:hypothetical protein